MKKLIKINNWALGITLVLYLTLYLGLLAQILLGFIQVVTAIAVTIGYYQESSTRLQIRIIIYWIVALLCLLLLWYETSYMEVHIEYSEGFVMIVFPMAVAIYFVILLKQINKYHENTRKPDIAL